MRSSLKRNGLSAKKALTSEATALRNHCGPYSTSVEASPPSTVMTCCGFCRNLNAPCGPPALKSPPSEITLPCLTVAAASATLSAVMKFSVPISSASPQRPQLRTSSAIRRKSLMLSAMVGSLNSPAALARSRWHRAMCPRTAGRGSHRRSTAPDRRCIRPPCCRGTPQRRPARRHSRRGPAER